MRTPKEDSSEMVLIVKTIEPTSLKLFYATAATFMKQKPSSIGGETNLFNKSTSTDSNPTQVLKIIADGVIYASIESGSDVLSHARNSPMT
jgi:hypothetical protein